VEPAAPFASCVSELPSALERNEGLREGGPGASVLSELPRPVWKDGLRDGGPGSSSSNGGGTARASMAARCSEDDERGAAEAAVAFGFHSSDARRAGLASSDCGDGPTAHSCDALPERGGESSLSAGRLWPPLTQTRLSQNCMTQTSRAMTTNPATPNPTRKRVSDDSPLAGLPWARGEPVGESGAIEPSSAVAGEADGDDTNAGSRVGPGVGAGDGPSVGRLVGLVGLAVTGLSVGLEVGSGVVNGAAVDGAWEVGRPEGAAEGLRLG